jgi:hypothetical protein
MKNLHTIPTRSASSSHRPGLLTLFVISTCMVFSFVLSACSGNLLSSTASPQIANASTTARGAGYPVKVYFSRSPDSLNNNAAVYAVDRLSATIAVATFSIQLLIAGPTLSEQQTGYFTELNTMFSGPSNCTGKLPVGGPDFTITLNQKGSVSETGTATLKFCRSLSSGGIGADARVTAEINATLKQFSNIKKVVILTKDGHCFGDESGKDFCLK